MAASIDPPEINPITVSRSDPLLRAVWREYAEMPGLSLTVRQGRRLWAVDESRCAELLDSLVSARLLIRTSDGHYARAVPSTAPGASTSNPQKRAIAG